MFVIEPVFPSWTFASYTEGKRLPAGFRYASDTNSDILTAKDMRALIDG